MELENAVEEELKDGGFWVPVTPPKPIPSKHNSNFINHGTGSHMGLAENPQNFHNFLDLNTLASEKENCCVDCEFGALNNAGRDHHNFEGANGAHPKRSHNFVGLDGASVKAPTQGIVGEKSADDRLFEEEIMVGAVSKHLENVNSDFLKHSTVNSTQPENQNAQKRSNSGIELEKRPRKRQKMKRHRPRIFDETKPRKTPKSQIEPSTPKPKTPRCTIPKSSTRGKFVRKGSNKVDSSNFTDGQASNVSFGCAGKTCRKTLHFNFENHEKAIAFTDDEKNYLSKDDSLFADSNCENRKCMKLANQKQEVLDRDCPGELSSQATNPNLNHCESPCKESWNISDSSLFMDGNGKPKIFYAYQRRNKSLITSSCKTDFNLNLEPEYFDSYSELQDNAYEYKSGEQSCNKAIYEGELKALKELEIDLNIQSCIQLDSLQVYQRIFKKNECLKNSRKLGPNCPTIYKNTRMKRLKKTTFVNHWIGPVVDKCQRKVNLKARCKKGVILSLHVTWGSYRKRSNRSNHGKRHAIEYMAREYKAVDLHSDLHGRALNMPVLKPKRQTYSTNARGIDLSSKSAERKENTALEFKHCHPVLKDMLPIADGEKLEYFTDAQNEGVQCAKDLDKLTSYRNDILEHALQCTNGLNEIPIFYQQQDHVLESVEQRENMALELEFWHSGNAFAKALVSSVIEKEAHLDIRSDECNQLFVHDKQTKSELVPLNKRKKRKPRPPKVDFDPETTRVWNKLMLTDGTEIPEVQKDNIDWEEKRKRMRGKVETFIAIMHHVQGNRRFSPWKGSVVDSVVGVFLTQNVSDHLSSSAFMSLAAKFPVRKDSESKEYSACGEKSLESDTLEPRTPEDKEQSYVHPTEQDMSYQFVENGESHVCSIGKAVAGSMEDDKSSVTNKSTSFRKLLQLEETKFLEQFYDHLERNMLCQQRIREEQRVKDSCSSDISCLNGTFASVPGGFLSHVDDNLNFVPPIATRNARMEKSNNLDHNNYYESEIVICGKDIQRTQRPLNAEILSSRKFHEVLMIGKKSDHESQLAVKLHDDTGKDEANIHHHRNKHSSGAKSRLPKEKRKVEADTPIDWDNLRKTYSSRSRNTANTIDSVDWEAVRKATVEEVSKAIEGRGQNNVLAGRIKDFLDRMVKDHGSFDLEWLRNVPPEKAKDYLLSVTGLGLKSVECLRLLTLHHVAFPVDTNVSRIAVRLGWVPLEPLPEDVQIHRLNQYPVFDAIQKYLWPRLHTLDQKTLYELHYQMITFGKVFCTKASPNCNACPLQGECRHFASAFASAKLRLSAPQQKSVVPGALVPSVQGNVIPTSPKLFPLSDSDFLEVRYESYHCEPIIEVPASPEPFFGETLVRDIEDFGYDLEDELDDIPTIRLNTEALKENILDFMEKTSFLCEDGDMSKQLVALSPQAASIPMPKLKALHRLRTEHYVYELPDSHPLLVEFEKREPDDPCPYLLAIWPTDETTTSSLQPRQGNTQDSDKMSCDASTCSSNDMLQQQNEIVKGTILIPCRTANRGCFPLNGTYFQVNEVFADHKTSRCPIAVPRKWIWNLRRRLLYCGKSTTSIFKGMSTSKIQHCFWKGYVCVRGVDRVSRDSRPLSIKFHPRSKKKGDEEEE